MFLCLQIDIVENDNCCLSAFILQVYFGEILSADIIDVKKRFFILVTFFNVSYFAQLFLL